MDIEKYTTETISTIEELNDYINKLRYETELSMLLNKRKQYNYKLESIEMLLNDYKCYNLSYTMTYRL